MMDDGLLRMIELTKIDPSAHNPRRIRENDPAIAELAQSIRESGLLQPVVCRPCFVDGRFELLAGRRRFEAHKLLGMVDVLAIVRDLSDEQAIEVTVLENLQREELSPIEEARGVASLVGTGHSLDRIADELGKSRSWVVRRAAVRHLLPGLGGLADEHGWSARRLEMLSRLPDETQRTMLELFTGARAYMVDPDGDDQVERMIADLTRTLKTMPWRKGDDGTLCPAAGPCADCPKRSSVHPDLFDEPGETGKAAHDTCLDGACYDVKAAAWTARREAELRQKHEGLVLVSSESNYGMSEAAKKRGAIECYAYERAKSKSAEGARPALMVDGSQSGSLVWIRTDRSKGKRPAVQTAGNVLASPAARLAAKREMLANRRNAWVIEVVADALSKSVLVDNFKALAFAENTLLLVGLAVAIGTDTRNSYGSEKNWKDAAKLYQGPSSDLLGKLWAQVADVMLERLKIYGAQQSQNAYKEAMEVRELLGLESEEVLQARAAMEIPEPKSWAKLEREAEQEAAAKGKKATAAGKAKKRRGCDA